jgi:exonuclease VII small subunit
MILKLKDQMIEIKVMEVPELIKETSIHYVFEPNTEHLHPVLSINGFDYKDNHIVIMFPHIEQEFVNLTVKLYDDNLQVVRTYRGELAYNKYQITGIKPVRPDFEKYIHTLESKVSVLESTVATLEENIRTLIIQYEESIKTLTLTYEARIKELEEKGEII